MAYYPSGIHGPLPGGDVTDPRARLAQIAQAMDDHPIGTSAPCANPECMRPVDYLGHGRPPFHCSPSCRARVSNLRKAATQQLDLIERTLEEMRGVHGVPRHDLHSRANQLRWWLAHLGGKGLG